MVDLLGNTEHAWRKIVLPNDHDNWGTECALIWASGQAKQPKGATGKPKPEKGGVQIKYMEGGRDKAKQMPLQYKNEKTERPGVKLGVCRSVFSEEGIRVWVAKQYGATCLMVLNMQYKNKNRVHTWMRSTSCEHILYTAQCTQYLFPLFLTYIHTHSMTSWVLCFLRNGMYCQVTQLEKQGGPEAQREMVRDREQAVHERSCVRLEGPKWLFFTLLKKSVALAWRCRYYVWWMAVCFD